MSLIRWRLARALLAAGFTGLVILTSVAAAEFTPRVILSTTAPPLRPVVEQLLPAYPPEAASLGIEKDLDVRVTVDSTGAVTGATIVGSTLLSRPEGQSAAWAEFVADHPRAFDDATVPAARQWTFAPGIVQWTSVFSVHFRLGPEGSPADHGVSRSGLLRAGLDVSAPRKIVDVKAVYPDTARAANAKGVVLLDTIIGADGSVTEVRVLRSQPLLDQAATDAVRQWRFQPTMLNGVPVDVSMLIWVAFTLAP